MTPIHLADENATRALATRLAKVARVGDVIGMSGGLGVGKTAFARAFIQARCGTETEVPSPTFTLVQTYESSPPFAGEIYHFDLFRIDAAEDALELGLEEALIAGISLIEWPDRLGPYLPAERLDLTFADAADGRDTAARRLCITGHGDWPQRMAEAGIG